jgi:hypothetical protein
MSGITTGAELGASNWSTIEGNMASAISLNELPGFEREMVREDRIGSGENMMIASLRCDVKNSFQMMRRLLPGLTVVDQRILNPLSPIEPQHASP